MHGADEEEDGRSRSSSPVEEVFAEMNDKHVLVRLRVPKIPRMRWLLVIAGGLMCLGAVAYAALPHGPFAAGDPLSAKALNDNFGSLDSRTTKLEGTKIYAGHFLINSTDCIKGGIDNPCTIDLRPAGFHGIPICTVTPIDIDGTGYARNVIIKDTGETWIRVFALDPIANYVSINVSYICVGT